MNWSSQSIGHTDGRRRWKGTYQIIRSKRTFKIFSCRQRKERIHNKFSAFFIDLKDIKRLNSWEISHFKDVSKTSLKLVGMKKKLQKEKFGEKFCETEAAFPGSMTSIRWRPFAAGSLPNRSQYTTTG
jgi:hypothetical protein